MGNYLKKGSASYILLSVLEKSVDYANSVNHFLQNPNLYIYGPGSTFIKKSVLSKAINRLKQKGFVETVLEDKDLLIKLTDEGKQILFLLEPEESKWDGKWRIVVFDVPEEKRLVRDLFRRNLKKWGFKPLQKSTWISQKHVTEKLVSYVKFLKIEKWVIVIESNKIEPNPVY